MKILITGATGFIGKYVVDELLKIGNNDIVLTASNEASLKKIFLHRNVKIIPFDIYTNSKSKIDLYKFFDYPDRLIHLAWKGLPNYNESFHITENLIQDFNFITNLIHNGLNDITITGTCFEYGMQEGELYENMTSSPTNFYAIAKDTLRKMLEIERLKYNFSFKWVRLFYMYGLGQNSNSLIPQLEIALKNGEQVFNMSGGEQIRDYLPVSEVAKNIVKIALQSEISGVINNCSGKPCKVVDFVKEYLLNNKKYININLGYYPYSINEPMAFWGNNKKLKTILD